MQPMPQLERREFRLTVQIPIMEKNNVSEKFLTEVGPAIEKEFPETIKKHMGIEIGA